MALKTVLLSLDDLPDAQHDLYKEVDGKFILDLEGVDDHPSITALKNALERQKLERKKATDEVAKLKERISHIPEDFDPEAYAGLLAELEELRADPNRGKMTDKEKQELVSARKLLEQKITKLEKDSKEAIEKKDTEIKSRDTFIGQLLIDDGLTKALIDAGVGKEYMKAAKALLRADCKVVQEDDGKYVAIVESDTGPLEISKYVQDWVASDEGKPFIPPAKGSDASNTSNRATKIIPGDKNPWSDEHWNMTEQGKLIQADRTKAEKLAKQVNKPLVGGKAVLTKPAA